MADTDLYQALSVTKLCPTHYWCSFTYSISLCPHFLVNGLMAPERSVSAVYLDGLTPSIHITVLIVFT